MRSICRIIPNWKSGLLAALAAMLLVLAFPDFEFWFLAWFALMPLMWAIEREKESTISAFTIGWLFGTAYFFGTCWWLTYAPIHYASFPWPLAYFLILIACIGAGIFPALFAAILALLLRRLGWWGFLAGPFLWVFSEFLRYWLTGNNWNAIGYSQAFSGRTLDLAAVGGVIIVGFFMLLPGSLVVGSIHRIRVGSARRPITSGALYTMSLRDLERTNRLGVLAGKFAIIGIYLLASAAGLIYSLGARSQGVHIASDQATANVVGIQPNVPMKGVDHGRLLQLRQRQFDVAEEAIAQLRASNSTMPTTVILPESPMNFMYNDDREFQAYVREFTIQNNVSLIFNSAEPDASNGKYFNSAMMIGPDGRPIVQYDKIYLLPFGEAVPVPLESVVPAFVGNFSYGREYDLLPFGDAKGGIMICFESHFGQLSREYVRLGADVLIEMTNDGYLGPTPVLRQHLANAVFRAVETNRPVLRVTNVGITANIDEKGTVLDPPPSYREDSRVWTVSKSDGSQTVYVRYGDWFGWLCTIVTAGLLVVGTRKTPG